MGTIWIFLDVDGVLNCTSTKELTPEGFIGVEDKKIRLLADFVHEIKASVVLTSDWKDKDVRERECNPGADLAYLLNKLADHGLNIAAYTRDGDRGAAVRDYLDRFPGCAVIFDDHWVKSFKAAGVSRYLVQTSGRSGLQPGHIRQAKKLLELQMLSESQSQNITQSTEKGRD